MPHRIFFVEDHAVIRLAVSTLLGGEADLDLWGVAESAEEALDGGGWAACDLLLTDVSLPGMDGIALTERVRSERHDFPVVVVSADAEPATVSRARAAGAQAYLSKMDLADTLARTLREVLDAGDSPMSTGEPAGPPR